VRLKAKFLKSGFAGLHDYEQLELLLTYAIARRDVKQMAKDLLTKFKSLAGVLDASIENLCQVNQVGESTAILIKTVKDLCSEYLATNMVDESVTLSTPEAVKDFARMKLGGHDTESFMVIYLDTRNHVLDHEILFSGTVNKTIVYPRNVIKNALLKNSVGIIIIHNHPSGSQKPSKHDLELTKSINEAADTVGMKLVDHLIVTQTNTFSFVENALI